MDIIKYLMAGGKRFTRFYLLLQAITCVAMVLIVFHFAALQPHYVAKSFLDDIVGGVFLGVIFIPISCGPVLVVALLLSLAFGD